MDLNNDKTSKVFCINKNQTVKYQKQEIRANKRNITGTATYRVSHRG